MLMQRVIASATLALVAGACSGPSAVDVAVPVSAIAEADWEAVYHDDEMTTWRTGIVRRMGDTTSSDITEHPPLAGATIELFAPHPHGRRPLRKVAETVSDADGRFRVGPGPAGAWVLRARHEDSVATFAGRVPMMVGAFPLPEGDISVLVRNGYPLEVGLIDDAGAPVAGARLRASVFGYEEIAVTDAAGMARFRAPRDKIRVEAMDPGRRGAFAEFAVPAAQDAAPYRLTAPDRGPVEGWVVDAVTGAPLAGAVVLHLSRPDILTTTDASGRFSLDAPHQGRIAALGRGRAWRSYDVPAAGEVELRLEPGVAVRGRVVDGSGAGVAGARLTAVAPNAAGGPEPVRGPVTGPDGEFVFDWFPRAPRGSGGVVEFLAYRRGLGWSQKVSANEIDGEVVLELHGERSIRGSIRRSGEEPCARIGVALESEVEGWGSAARAYLGAARVVGCETLDDGSFAASGFPAHAPARVSFTIDTIRVVREVPPGGDVDLDIVLPPGKAIAGRVVDVHGQPITLGGSARAELIDHPDFETFTRETVIGPDGTFRIDDLPDGRYSVRADVPTFDVGGAVANAGGDAVELVAERPAHLDFEVVFPDGAEQERVVVELRDADDPAVPARRTEIRPGADGGRGQIRIVRLGRYHISAAGGAWRCRMRDVEIPDGKRAPIRLVMERTIVRKLHLESAEGEPLPNRRVIVAPIGRRGVGAEQFFTGEGGGVEIGGLAEGRWIARVVEKGRPPLEVRFEVTPDDMSEIRMRFAPHGTLDVVIDRDALADPDNALVSLRGSDGSHIVAWGPDALELSSRWRVPASGELELRGVPVGAVSVVLETATGVRAEREVEVEVERGEAGRTTVRLP